MMTTGYPQPDPLEDLGVMLNYTIRDSVGGTPSVDLRDILAAVGPAAFSAKWTVECAECTGAEMFEGSMEAADEVKRYSGSREGIAGSRLVQLAALIVQMIDGTFSGRLAGAKNPFIEVDAVEGEFWIVRTSDYQVVNSILNRFNEVNEEAE